MKKLPIDLHLIIFDYLSDEYKFKLIRYYDDDFYINMIKNKIKINLFDYYNKLQLEIINSKMFEIKKINMCFDNELEILDHHEFKKV